MLKILSKVVGIIIGCFKHRRCHHRHDIAAIQMHVKASESNIPEWYTDRDKREIKRQIKKLLTLIEAFESATTLCKNHVIAEIIHELEKLDMKLPQDKKYKK